MTLKKCYQKSIGITFSALLTIFFCSNSYGDGWEKTFGGSDDDWGYSAQQTSDGGFIIAGMTRSFGAGSLDVYLIKTNTDGSLTWEKTFGGTGGDHGYAVDQTTDGGYIIAGLTGSFGAGGSDVYLIKTDADGNLVWQKTFGGEDFDIGNSVKQTADGGYIVTGATESFGAGKRDVYLIKTDANGNLVWQKTFGGLQGESGNEVQQTADGGYIITGSVTTGSVSGGESDVYLIKTDSNGNLVWQKAFGGEDNDHGYSVDQTADGGYIVTGSVRSFGAGESDVYLIKTDADGKLIWEKAFGGSSYDFGRGVQQTTDGGYIIVGGYDVDLLKFDGNGILTWDEVFGTNYAGASGRSVQQTSDGGYIIGASTNGAGGGTSDVYLIYYRPNDGSDEEFPWYIFYPACIKRSNP